MDEAPTYEEKLIARYLSGESSAEEISQLKTWLEADDSHPAIFKEYRNSWALVEAASIESETDADSEWDRFAGAHMPVEPKQVKLFGQSPVKGLMRVAAVFLVLIMPAAIYFLFFMSPQQTILSAENIIVESTLPDGTEVALNTGSVLHYPEKFRGNERNVNLEGEAYFDVSRNEHKAFVIDAGPMQIRVLGTSFYVNTRGADNTMEVVLMSGRVQLDYNGKTVQLEPGQKAIVNNTSRQITKQQNDDPNLLAWKTKVLRFDNTPLSRIVAALEKVYHKDIVVLNPDLLQCRITASFEGESFESVLQVIQSTLDITVRPNGKTLEFSGEACH